MRSRGGMAVKYIVLGVILLLISIGAIYGLENRENAEVQAEATEEFIHRWLQNDNDTIATYILDSDEKDEDLVKGRESLAETVGLLMFYALGKDDEELFDELYDQLNAFFLEEDGFLNWKVNENGVSEVSTNALIDDIRILDALIRADEKWGKAQYLNTAQIVGQHLTAYNVNNGIYTDFYEKEELYASPSITLPYIDIQAMNTMVEKGLLDADIVAETSQVLIDAPLRNGFYPISYNVETEEYTFDENPNLMHQAILVYHFVQAGERSEEFLNFLKNEMENRGLIHGVYDIDTKEPTVDYESPAVYGYLISYALIAGEDELAEDIYNRMKEFLVTDKNSEYYGGYSITDGDTHIFDNLIPLLAEQDLLNK